MKKYIIIFACAVFAFFLGYNIYCYQLFNNADKLVNDLDEKYEAYGLFSIDEFIDTTAIGNFQTFPLGRLINVRINKPISNDIEYSILQNVLKFHYLGNSKVKDVYKCNGGTLVIDCRH